MFCIHGTLNKWMDLQNNEFHNGTDPFVNELPRLLDAFVSRDLSIAVSVEDGDKCFFECEEAQCLAQAFL